MLLSGIGATFLMLLFSGSGVEASGFCTPFFISAVSVFPDLPPGDCVSALAGFVTAGAGIGRAGEEFVRVRGFFVAASEAVPFSAEGDPAEGDELEAARLGEAAAEAAALGTGVFGAAAAAGEATVAAFAGATASGVTGNTGGG